MEHNRSPISLRQGKVFLDGIEVMDEVACSIKFTPDVWTGRQVGDFSPSSRWLGYTITGSITRRRNNTWLKETIMRYIREKRTPEFTIQGIMNDECSDYFQQFGSDTVTAVGCVLTGDLTLLNHDSNGDVLDDVIAFNVKDVV
jgi:hypothetical protein